MPSEKFDDLILIPPKNLMNRNLSSAREDTMLNFFGKPGQLTKTCTKPTGKFAKQLLFKQNVGPFVVSGLDVAVESLSQLFAEVQNDLPDVYANVKTTGMLCVRSQRRNANKFSNHSWGTAIDIYFGFGGVVRQGSTKTHRGNFLLAPYFERHGWYWGAEFSGDYVDSMHFEMAEETILKLGNHV